MARRTIEYACGVVARRPARRSRRCGHHLADPLRRTRHVPLLVRHAARRCRRQQPGSAGGRPDDRGPPRRFRVVDAAAPRRRPVPVVDDRRASPDPPLAHVHRRRAPGPARRIRRIPGARRGAPSTGRGPRRFRHLALGIDGAGPRDPAGVCRGRRTRRRLQRPPWRSAVRGTHPAAHMASARGRNRAHHVEPGRCGVVAGNPFGASGVVAASDAVVSVRRVGPRRRAARGGDRTCIRQGDDAGPPETTAARPGR